MKPYINHLQINIDYQNVYFYKDLLNFLGWKVIMEEKEIIGFSGSSGSLWFTQKQKNMVNDYDGVGVNHIGIGVSSMVIVDETAQYLKTKGIKLLFGTPKHRPDFSSENETYYQVMFESPDKLLFEVVYTGPK